MSTQQPKWRYIANLGDVNPFDYGGYFVYVDETGVYPPEAEYLTEPLDCNEEQGQERWLYRVVLDPLKVVDGYLVPAGYEPSWPHPVASYDEWFHRDLEKVAGSCGMTGDYLRNLLLSDDPVVRADAYRSIAEYHGWENFDDNPQRFLNDGECEVWFGDRVRNPDNVHYPVNALTAKPTPE